MWKWLKRLGAWFERRAFPDAPASKADADMAYAISGVERALASLELAMGAHPNVGGYEPQLRILAQKLTDLDREAAIAAANDADHPDH